MLAQNFIPAEALGITQEQHDALVTTLRFFERGEVPLDEFSMGTWCETSGCGTVRCIGGWCEHFAERRELFGHEGDEAPYKLYGMFYPEASSTAWFASPEQGAAALRNYLTTGDPQWEQVMSDA